MWLEIPKDTSHSHKGGHKSRTFLPRVVCEDDMEGGDTINEELKSKNYTDAEWLSCFVFFLGHKLHVGAFLNTR